MEFPSNEHGSTSEFGVSSALTNSFGWLRGRLPRRRLHYDFDYSAFLGGSGAFGVDTVLVAVTVQLVLFASMLVFIFALAPTILILIYAERHAIRSPGSYAVAGMAIAISGGIVHLLFSSVFGDIPSDGLVRSAFKVLLFESILTLPAGLCAGLTFWAIAGRGVGKKTIKAADLRHVH